MAATPTTPSSATGSTDADTKPVAQKIDTAAAANAAKVAEATGDGTSAVAKIADNLDDATAGNYTVAPGRTVDGKRPGEKVKLDAKDAARMLELGFILDRDGSIVLIGEGPAVNVEDGVQVKTGF